MSTITLPTAARFEQSLSTSLSVRERLRLGTQLGSAMLATGLLVAGTALRWAGPVENRPLAELVKAAAAIVVSLPLLWTALRSAWTGAAPLESGPLVLLATIAAFAQGDFLTASLIPILMTIGHVLEERSILGAQAAIDGLKQLQGRSATVLAGEKERQISAEAIRPGDVLVVRPGERIAADGVVRDGTSSVDQSSVTGESRPEDLDPGGSVFAGTLNLTGLLHVEVTRTGDATTIGRVVSLLRDAERSKTPVMRLIEQYSAWYTPVVLVIAAIVLVLSRDMTRAVAVLVVSCPMAIILSGPAAMVAALAAASRLGILIKNTKFLEVLSNVDTVVLDKTGTVTLGQLKVASLHPVQGISEDVFVADASTCAAGSRHPVSRAITAFAEGRGVAAVPTQQFFEKPGKGVEAVICGATFLMGRRDWLVEEGLDPIDGRAATLPEFGSIVWLGRREEAPRQARVKLLGFLVLTDEVRSEARAATDELRALGIGRQILLTGDRRAEAERVAAALSVDACVSEVLPEQKLEAVRGERKAGRRVMVVGDGVNDALALASGDVGIAMGAAGSDVALRSADVVLMASDLHRLPQAVRLARRTRSTIHQNILIGTAISLLMLALAASGAISPIAGALLHNVGELYVLVNSARLLRFQA